MNSAQTIAAISSAVGPAARMIVRVSGSDAIPIAGKLPATLPESGHVASTQLAFAGLIFPASVYLFAEARSYTGEPIVEFHIPGNPLLARMLLDALIEAGARHADPGEFTARAYFNGRMDLSEAEGVAAMIAAHSEQELRAARQLMAGELARQLRPTMDELTESLALLEAGIDFSDEDISFISREELANRIDKVRAALVGLLAQSDRFERLNHEPTLVLVGRPNAGKSTLLNALAGHERAMVSPVAGTTRDVLSSHVRLRRGVVRLLDVAGIDENAPSADVIEKLMDEHARRAIEAADWVIVVRSLTDDRSSFAASRVDLVVMTKADLAPAEPVGGECIVSAVTGQGMNALRERLDELAFATAGGADVALNARHVQCISQAQQSLDRARDIAASAGHELIALELREALDALGGVLGQVAADEVLGRIFATFCIGK